MTPEEWHKLHVTRISQRNKIINCALIATMASFCAQVFAGGTFSEVFYGYLIALGFLVYALLLPRKWHAEDCRLHGHERWWREQYPDDEDSL